MNVPTIGERTWCPDTSAAGASVGAAAAGAGAAGAATGATGALHIELQQVQPLVPHD